MQRETAAEKLAKRQPSPCRGGGFSLSRLVSHEQHSREDEQFDDQNQFAHGHHLLHGGSRPRRLASSIISSEHEGKMKAAVRGGEQRRVKDATDCNTADGGFLLSEEFESACIADAHNALMRVAGARSRAASARFRAEQIEAMKENLKAIDYSLERVAGGSACSDRAEDLMRRMEQVATECREAASEWIREADRAKVVLDRMTNQEHAAILEMHYLAGASWANTATAFGYSGPGIYDVRKTALKGFFESMLQGIS